MALQGQLHKYIYAYYEHLMAFNVMGACALPAEPMLVVRCPPFPHQSVELHHQGFFAATEYLPNGGEELFWTCAT